MKEITNRTEENQKEIVIIDNTKKEKTTMEKIFGFGKFVIISALIFVFLTNVGKIVDMTGLKERHFENSKVVPKVDYDLDKEILAAMDTAEQAAYQYASDELDRWISEMMGNTDRFLDEYFEFTSTKGREISAFYHWGMNKIFSGHKTAAEALMDNLEHEISKHLMNKEVAQSRIDNITNGAVKVFMDTFGSELVKLQEKHNIPRPDWDKHIYRICSMTAEYDAKSVPVASKIVVASGAAITIKVATPALSWLGEKVGQKMAAKAGAKYAAAAAGGAKKFAKFIPGIGTVIAISVIGWDLLDYKVTSERSKRDLRTGLEEYFQEMKAELLGPTEDSIMGSIYMWENNLKANIN